MEEKVGKEEEVEGKGKKEMKEEEKVEEEEEQAKNGHSTAHRAVVRSVSSY